MNKELVINSTLSGVEIALLENSKLVELHKEKLNNKFTVGDIFLGKVRKINPGLNAAFIDVGYKKDAFLHYTDLGPKIRTFKSFTTKCINGQQTTSLLKDFKKEPEIIKTGKMQEVFDKKESVLVQVLKEPISTKGPRLSSEITLAGRFLVLVPFSNTISISKKIKTSEERKRLQRLIESIKPQNFGLILRTAAEGKKASEIHDDLTYLTGRWDEILKQLKGANPVVKVLSEIDKTSSVLRDFLSVDFNKITVNNEQVADDIKAFVTKNFPEKKNIVSYYNDTKPIFDEFGITKQIKASFGKTAAMPSGAYLVIEHTEAMHVVDVNSGYKPSQGKNQAQTALEVNLESAIEVARQARLRDLGGIIIVDFIDMRDADHRKQVYNALKESMSVDKARHTILPLSKFCLMQITRQRTRPEIQISTKETCPSCKGTGNVMPIILLIDEIQRNLDFLVKKQNQKDVIIRVHPFVASYMTKGLMSMQMKWFLDHFNWIKVEEDANYQLTEYRFFDKSNDEIKLS